LFEYFRPDSAIVWNGNPLGGGDAFVQMYATMPQTYHEVTDFNVHPLPSADQMILNTSGKVKFGTERAKNLYGFSAVFILRKDSTGLSSRPYIASLSYRLVHKPDDSTLQM
jgi:NTF2-related export protein 1/2